MDNISLFWTNDLSTGVEEIDNDHKALFSVFQDAYWTSKENTDAADIYCMMANLLNYTEVHFEREEALMSASPYPHFDHHRAIHQQLIKQLKQQIILVQENIQTPSHFVLFIKDWFIEHINGTDKRIEPHTKNCLDSIDQAIGSADPLHMQSFCHVHLVDDDEMYVELLYAMGKEAGLRATAYSSSIQFLNASIFNRDIIVLDLNMPHKDGIEVMRELADQQINPTFILISGFDNRVLQSARQFAESRQLHVAEILNKPVDSGIFINLLKKINLDNISSYINTEVSYPKGETDPNPSKARIKSGSIKSVITLNELKRGIDQQEFIVHLQPQVRFSDGSLCGVEALIRWQHPEKGLIFPDQIIPLAEDNQLMGELTQVVIFQSIKAYSKLKSAGYKPSISINISAQNIVDLKFPEQLDVLLKAHDLEPESFILELTESAILTDTSVALDIFNRLRMKGFSLSIDDFGTGDSSLKKLYESPFTELKIDQHFVSRMVNDKEASSIVKICTVLADEFNMTTVAEGVETLDVWNKLKELGCDIAQGYFISKPLPADDFINWAKSYVPTNESYHVNQ